MHYLQLQYLVPEENVKWIDMINGLVDSPRDFSSEGSGFENLLVYMWIHLSIDTKTPRDCTSITSTY